ncbi:hypothetical protein BJY52DRAFT_1224187 [Lactarius psammicola]|nr:hypothetical protein BJY52DRAFT_1224187 [Lactarius psammicola]
MQVVPLDRGKKRVFAAAGLTVALDQLGVNARYAGSFQDNETNSSSDQKGTNETLDQTGDQELEAGISGPRFGMLRPCYSYNPSLLESPTFSGTYGRVLVVNATSGRDLRPQQNSTVLS